MKWLKIVLKWQVKNQKLGFIGPTLYKIGQNSDKKSTLLT